MRLLLDHFAHIATPKGQQAIVGTPQLLHWRDGAIMVEGDVIVDIGTSQEVHERCREPNQILDMSGKTAIPGLVDPHTHLVFAGNRADEFNRRLHGETYVSIAQGGGGIHATVRATRQADESDLRRRATRVLDQMLLHGVTTIEAKSGYGLDHDTELKQLNVMRDLSASHPVDMVQTFMGAHEVPKEYKGDAMAYVAFLNRDMLPEIKRRGDVRYVDIFCERGVFELEATRLHMQAAAEHGFGLRFHADELVHMGGAGLAADLGAVSADHVVYASKSDMKKMADAGVIATLLPGTSFFLRGNYADAKAFKEAGCAIALSTDFNPGSSHTCSQALMMALACMNMGMTFEETLVGTTLNAAAAIHEAHRVGSLEPGKLADIAILDVEDAVNLVYYWGINHVCHVMKAGSWAVWQRQIRRPE